MASVLVHTTMSLDGFIAGPGHEMDSMRITRRSPSRWTSPRPEILTRAS